MVEILAFIRMRVYIEACSRRSHLIPAGSCTASSRSRSACALLALAAEEELAIGELAGLLGESQPNISRHLTPLKQAGLVLVRPRGHPGPRADRRGGRGRSRGGGCACERSLPLRGPMGASSASPRSSASAIRSRASSSRTPRGATARAGEATDSRGRCDGGLRRGARAPSSFAQPRGRRGQPVTAPSLDVLAPSFERVVAVESLGRPARSRTRPRRASRLHEREAPEGGARRARAA